MPSFLHHNPIKWRINPKLPDKLFNIIHVPGQHCGLLLDRHRSVHVASRALPPGRIRRKYATQLTGTALEEAGERVPRPRGAGDGRSLGHEPDVDDLGELLVDGAAGAVGHEGGDGEEAVEGLKAAAIRGGVDEHDGEEREGRGLDSGTVYGLD